VPVIEPWHEIWVCRLCGTKHKVYGPDARHICLCRPYTMPDARETEAVRMEAFRHWQKSVNRG
jgi:hypothetical protein